MPEERERTGEGDDSVITIQGAISLKLIGGKVAPKLLYFVLRKELLNLSEMPPRDT